ncbi:MAG: DUF1573 domain-containing protein [Planctomycetaceae bacterium]|nr:DUF1573 domain-containing protein [Planctomycetaceae bacterium]
MNYYTKATLKFPKLNAESRRCEAVVCGRGLFGVVLFLFLFFGLGRVYSESWGESLFETRQHDFGRVALGVKAEYRFAINNRFKQDVRVISLNTSCGCTSSVLSSESIVSGSTEYLIATLNTDGQYTHESKAIITIHFEVLVGDRLLRDSAQVAVSGYIRPDVVLSAGAIEFGAVKRGETVVKKIRLEYAGEAGWELTRVERNNPYIHVKAEAIPFPDGSFWRNGEIHYQITATLKPDAPAGYVKDVVTFSTNENSSKIKNNSQDNGTNGRGEITIPIDGVITEPLRVKPSSFVVGLDNNADVSKNIVIRSSKQFRILGVSCEDKRFKFTFSEHESSIQIVAAFFRTKNNDPTTTQNNNEIKILTNLPDQKLITLETIKIEKNIP